MPAVAILLIKTFPLHVAVAITLGVLAVTPVPPLLPKSQLKTGAHADYVIGLLVSQSVLAIVLVPVTVGFMDFALGAQAHFGVGRVTALVAETILLPLAAGIVATKLLPKLRSLARPLLQTGTCLLVAGSIPLLILGWKSFSTLAGNGAIVALAIFIIAGIAVGHLLGGPRVHDRATLAAATSSRHPALALAIAQANFPEQARLVAGALVIYLLLRMALLYPYLRWMRPPQNGS
jgi:BASS family bile acid:Na+ symporter